MLTFQDLLTASKLNDEEQRMQFVQNCISEHEASPAFHIARDAELYYRHLNPTIMRAEKMMYDALGRSQRDPIAANHKIPCRYYYYFISQTVMYLLGNGVNFQNKKTKDRLGGAGFDYVLQQAATKALNAGVSFGFLNYDHVEVMPLCGGHGEVSFAPLYDEENGSLRAGVRYWQIHPDKPLRATLFEEDGYTEYIRRKGVKMEVLQQKRPYKVTVARSAVDGMQILSGENWGALPIVPMFNVNRQSELIGGKSTLDSYDLMLSQLVNNVNEGALLYWIIQNADGMTVADDQAFIERIKTIHIAHTDEGQNITPQQIDVPFQASEASLERLRNQLFDDFMALDVKNIANGAATATQIEAAYEPMNIKASMLESCVTAFIKGILDLLGIDDEPTYQPDTIINKAEEIQNVLQSASYLSDDFTTRKLMTIMGDVDAIDDVLKDKLSEEAGRFEKKTVPAKQEETQDEQTDEETEDGDEEQQEQEQN